MFDINEMLVKLNEMGRKPGAEFGMYAFFPGVSAKVGISMSGCFRYHIYVGAVEENAEDPTGFTNSEEGVRNYAEAWKLISDDPLVVYDTVKGKLFDIE